MNIENIPRIVLCKVLKKYLNNVHELSSKKHCLSEIDKIYRKNKDLYQQISLDEEFQKCQQQQMDCLNRSKEWIKNQDELELVLTVNNDPWQHYDPLVYINNKSISTKAKLVELKENGDIIIEKNNNIPIEMKYYNGTWKNGSWKNRNYQYINIQIPY